jgi:hypothetical protein
MFLKASSLFTLLSKDARDETLAACFRLPTNKIRKGQGVPNLCVGQKLKIANFVFVPTLQLSSFINPNPAEEFNGQR